MATTTLSTQPCSGCSMVEDHHNIPVADVAEWQSGTGRYIQDIFPTMTAGQREHLMSGMCGACFDALFASE